LIGLRAVSPSRSIIIAAFVVCAALIGVAAWRLPASSRDPTPPTPAPSIAPRTDGADRSSRSPTDRSDVPLPARVAGWYDAAYDLNGDGVIDLVEERAAKGAPSGEIDPIARWDTDGDGTISEAEKAAAEAAIRERREREMLAAYDLDADGVLSDAEREAMNAPKREAAERQRAWELAFYDTDGDGVLSPGEERAMRERREALVQQVERAMVERFDGDQDGVLSRPEQEAALRTLVREFEDLRLALAVDTDADGVADGRDLIEWARRVREGAAGADLNADGAVDALDVEWAREAIEIASTRPGDPAWEAAMLELKGGALLSPPPPGGPVGPAQGP